MHATQPSSTIYFQTGPLAGNTFHLQIGINAIGSDPSNQIVIKDDNISSNHAQLMLQPNGCWMADLDSEGGTYVNGQKLTASVWLLNNDQIQLGNSTIVFQFVEPSQAVISTPGSQSTKQKSGCLRNCLLIVAILLTILCCGLVLLGGWGYTQYQSGELIPQTITNWLGFGVGEIRVANLTDGALDVALYEIDEETGGPILYEDFSLESLDMGTIGTILPKSYELRFIFSEANSIGGSCWMEIESGDIFQFIAVPEGIAVTLEGYEHSDPDELDFLTTSLCKP